MTSPITDGTYNIRNVQYPESVINLSNGLPYAAINGWPLGSSTNLRWIVKNVGTNNWITLENVTARGYYTSVDYFFRGAPAFGSPNPTYWTVKEVSKGVYTLEAKGFLLDLHRGGPTASIMLGPLHQNSTAEEQQWTFERVNN